MQKKIASYDRPTSYHEAGHAVVPQGQGTCAHLCKKMLADLELWGP